MGKKTIYLVCNAHLDPVWLWEWEEGAAEAVSTFRTAANICEESDGFVFNHNEVILYKWVEEYEPALFERIQRLVREGKWHIMGGWYLQPDCNMPSGESFVRQILLGRSYFKEKFGAEPTTAINFDPFGHTRGLVQIMAKSGYDSYLFCRPGQADMELDSSQFVWVGYDGSEVLATRAPDYNSPLGKAVDKIRSRFEEFADNECNVLLWGVGNHGGGPSRKDVRDIAALICEDTGFMMRHSAPEDYFAHLKKFSADLPRREKDMNPWAVGCYTSQVRIKQKHRLLENELYSLEKMAVSAALQGAMAYPRELLKEALNDLAMCEFHDILPGSSIQPVEEMSVRVLDHGLETVSRLKARAFFALASGQPAAKEDEIPILVYNPHPFKTKAVVECEFQLADQNWNDEFTLTRVFHGDRPIPCQNEKENSNLNLDWRKRVVFIADLEPGQMNRFDCRMEVLAQKPAHSLDASGDAVVFKTPEVEIVINTKTGFVDKYRVNGVDYVGEGAFKPVVIKDSEDAWGMLTHGFRELIGEFKLMNPEEGTKFSGVTAGIVQSVRVVEDGDVRAVVEAVFDYDNSAICQRYMLPKIGTELEVQTRVHWNEKDCMLKLQVPMLDGNHKYIGQVAYGRNDLPINGDEAVAQKWVAVVSDDSRALTCINDSIYGSDFSEDGLRLSLLRSPAYSGHPIYDRRIVPQDRYLPRIDQGERLYRFWFNAGPARERLEKIDREALVRNEKPFALSFFPSGVGKELKPLAVLSDEIVQITAIKMAEDGDDLIIRLFEPSGKKRTTTLSLPCIGIAKEITISAFEIKTLRVDVKNGEVAETDLMEKKLQ